MYVGGQVMALTYNPLGAAPVDCNKEPLFTLPRKLKGHHSSDPGRENVNNDAGEMPADGRR
jgi:hypothetical protein